MNISLPARAIPYGRRLVIKSVRFEIIMRPTAREQFQRFPRAARILIQTDTSAVRVHGRGSIVEIAGNSSAAVPGKFYVATAKIGVAVESGSPGIATGEQREEENNGEGGQEKCGRSHYSVYTRPCQQRIELAE